MEAIPPGSKRKTRIPNTISTGILDPKYVTVPLKAIPYSCPTFSQAGGVLFSTALYLSNL